MLRVVSLFLILSSVLAAQGQLEVIAAYYGAGRQFFDVTEVVRGQAQPDGLSFTVGAGALSGDPLPGVAKSLRLYYKWTGQFQSSEFKDGETVGIGRVTGRRGSPRETRTANGVLQITGATYGANGRTVDATAVLQGRVRDDRLEFEVNGANLADPAPGTLKELLVTYSWQGRTAQAQARDGEILRLPPGTPVALAPPILVPVGLKLISATYGLGARQNDVLARLNTRTAGDRLSVTADNDALGGDPARGAAKLLTVVYEWNGQRYTDTSKEGQTLRLPRESLLPAAAIADGVCFFPGANHQGTAVCFGQDQDGVTGRFASVRLMGRARTLDLFESANYGGRTLRLAADVADLSQVSPAGGGFFGNSAQYAWALTPASLRIGQ